MNEHDTFDEKTVPDYDGNLKRATKALFYEAIEMLNKPLFDAIDRSKPPVFLDNELQAILKDKYRDVLKTDLLAKVFLQSRTGKERVRYILLHIEFEANPKEGFGFRVFKYMARIADALNTADVSTLVLYTGKTSKHQVGIFQHQCFGTELLFKFNTVIAVNLEEKELSKDNNPFALILLAIVFTIKTSGKGKNKLDERIVLKKKLVQLLLRKHFDLEISRTIAIFVSNYVFLDKRTEKIFISQVNTENMENVITEPTFAEKSMARVIYKIVYGFDPHEERGMYLQEMGKMSDELSKKREQLSEKDEQLSEKDEQLSEKDEQLEKLQLQFLQIYLSLKEQKMKDEEIKSLLGDEAHEKVMQMIKKNKKEQKKSKK